MNVIAGHYRLSVNGVPHMFLTVPNDTDTLTINSMTPAVQTVFLTRQLTQTNLIIGVITPGHIPYAIDLFEIADTTLVFNPTNQILTAHNLDVTTNFYMWSPNGTRWSIIVQDNGQVKATNAPPSVLKGTNAPARKVPTKDKR
jgi:hypothetical protein